MVKSPPPHYIIYSLFVVFTTLFILYNQRFVSNNQYGTFCTLYYFTMVSVL